MRRIDRKELRAPARVLDLDLSTTDNGNEETLSVEKYDSVWCVSRIDGVPQDVSFWDVANDTTVSIQELRRQISGESASRERPIRIPESSAQAAEDQDLTVVICTRDRPEGLRSTLALLQDQTDSKFGVVVVDNAPSSAEAEAVVETIGLARCDYVVEPRPGLSRARNRGLRAVGTDLVAWIDDDEVPDADWVRRLKQGFAHDARPAAVCGVMLPAELEFEAQVRFEQYGGFFKGRGMAPEVLRKDTPSVISPLYPLPPFGTGGNMAFQTEALLSVGGFDPCLGAGTRTHGAEETRVMSMLLSGGHALLYWPAAITWHTHRRDIPALEKQLYGYGAGTAAFYASMIRHRPAVAFGILRLLPHALRDFRNASENQRTGDLPDDFPAHLLKANRRGLLKGGFMYAYESLRDLRYPVSAA
jgi:glycosyltransferase involved in cell wall biosynthesis